MARAGRVGVPAGGRNQKQDRNERAGDLSGVVLVDTVQADQGIEDEQPGLELLNAVGEALAIDARVQAQGMRGDDFDGIGIEGSLGNLGDAFRARRLRLTLPER